MATPSSSLPEKLRFRTLDESVVAERTKTPALSINIDINRIDLVSTKKHVCHDQDVCRVTTFNTLCKLWPFLYFSILSLSHTLMDSVFILILWVVMMLAIFVLNL